MCGKSQIRLPHTGHGRWVLWAGPRCGAESVGTAFPGESLSLSTAQITQSMYLTNPNDQQLRDVHILITFRVPTRTARPS